MNTQQQSKKGKPRSAGRRKSKIAAYYELRYPLRKLRRIWHDTHSTARLREWADAYKAPSGLSGNAALIRLGKELRFSV